MPVSLSNQRVPLSVSSIQQSVKPGALQLSVKDQVANALFTRPERGNSLSVAAMREFRQLLDSVACDESANVLVLRAQGRHFCAGADLDWVKALVTGDAGTWAEGIECLFDLLLALHEFPKPVIAAVQGSVIGGGVSVLCLCDEVIALDEVSWRLPEVNLGMVPTAVLPALLQRVPRAALPRLLFEDKSWTSAQAVAWGLASKSIKSNDFESVLAERIAQWLSVPSAVFAQTQKLQRQLDCNDFLNQIEIARLHALQTLNSIDARGRINALIKR